MDKKLQQEEIKKRINSAKEWDIKNFDRMKIFHVYL
jgi:hypothetical protein